VTVRSRWAQLGLSLLAMIMIANLQYAWTLFVPPIQRGTTWSLSDIQWAFSLFIFFQTWAQPAQGWLIDRLGPSGFIAAAGVLCGAGWAGMGITHSLPVFYSLYVVAGVGAALVYSGCMASAIKWFRNGRGLAAGIMAAGFGGGTALFIPLIEWLIQVHGYRAAFIWSGVAQGVVILAVAPWICHPAEAALRPAVARPGVPFRDRRPQFATLAMLRTGRFYALYTAFVLVSTGGLLVTAQARPMSVHWGYAADVVTLAVALGAIANGASRIFWGWVSDRAGRERTMAAAFGLHAVSLLVLSALGPRSETWFVVALVLVFFTWGEIFSLFPSTIGDYFGARHATSNYSMLYTAKGVSAIIVAGGPAALLFERYGSWAPVLYMSAAMAVVAAIIGFALRARAARPQPAAQASPWRAH
jgi:MFS transporter, OFA family, oxalate/formate antiporter